MTQCEVCGTGLVQGRGPARRTCSAACRQKAHRRKQAAEVERLRGLATAEAPARAPERVSRNEPASLGDGAAGLPEWLRSLWLDLGSAVEMAASGSESGWDVSESRVTADDVAFAIRYRADKLAEAVLASVPPSRSEAPVLVAEAGETPTSSPALETSRNEPLAAPSPTPVPAAPEAARNEPARPMSQKKAREFTAGAHLVSRDRETHRYEVVTSDGTVVGHVQPSYKAGRRHGWNGWAAGSFRSSSLQAHSTRDQAGADALGQWIRIVTAKPRR